MPPPIWGGAVAWASKPSLVPHHQFLVKRFKEISIVGVGLTYCQVRALFDG
jgi:hypothetical protein